MNLFRYVTRRIVLIIPVLLGVSVCVGRVVVT